MKSQSISWQDKYLNENNTGKQGKVVILFLKQLWANSKTDAELKASWPPSNKMGACYRVTINACWMVGNMNEWVITSIQFLKSWVPGCHKKEETRGKMQPRVCAPPSLEIEWWGPVSLCVLCSPFPSNLVWLSLEKEGQLIYGSTLEPLWESPLRMCGESVLGIFQCTRTASGSYQTW